MKSMRAIVVVSGAMWSLIVATASAGDPAFFLGRTCSELIRDIAAVNRADAVANDAITNARDRTAREKGLATASAVLVETGGRSSADRDSTDNIVSQIRARKALIARALQQKQCAA